MTDNYCVIMAGGIGSRFWPLSRESYPKQFRDILGTGRSLLQMTYDRFAQIVPQENIFVVSNDQYSDLVKQQLPQLDEKQMLIEPSRRNTAPCIAYAVYHIQAINPRANIVVAPSDHLIVHENLFIKNIKKGLQFVQDNEVLLTMGIRPSRPETGYGYIQSYDSDENGFSKVKTFTEKPDIELAKIFYESGEFFWNSGIFLWNVNTILKAFRKYMPDITARFELGAPIFNTPEEETFIRQNFPYCPNISIDYAIMEKAENAYMLCVDYGWADLGTWGSLYETTDKDENANTIVNGKALFYESAGNIVAMDNPKRLVIVQGMDDCIVAECGNVLMICKRDDEQRIKQFMADAQLKHGKEYN